jgi:hypothetical protein
VLALPCLLAGACAQATPVYPDDIPQPGPDSQSIEDRRRFTMELMKTAPLPIDKPSTIPELADPLAMGRNTGLNVFDGPVHHIDLLASPMMDDSDLADIELPPGSLRGIDILDDLDALYLSYDGRAFDRSVQDVKNAEIVERKGVPITTEGSPLNLMDFGKIVESRPP